VADVIERLLGVEQEARRVIARAEEEAAGTVDRAREEARHIVAEGHEQARREAEELLAATARTLQQEKEGRVEEEKGRLPSADSLDPVKLEEAVRFAVGVIAYGNGKS
jgi:vacuolar-type H+-ATPase subunit H